MKMITSTQMMALSMLRPPAGPPGDGAIGMPALRRQSSGTSSSATMLMILMSGLMAGPAVSL